MRRQRDDAFGGEALESFAHRTSADVEFAGEIGLDQLLTGDVATGEDTARYLFDDTVAGTGLILYLRVLDHAARREGS